MNVDKIIDQVLVNEKGFQKWKNDRGNWYKGKLIGTNWGIIPERLAQWRGVDDVTEADMRALTADEARAIYRHHYYVVPKIELLPDFLEEVVMDWYVTSGTWAIVRLQRMLTEFGYPCREDGKIGPETVTQAYACSREVPEDVILSAYYETRCDYYETIARQRPANKDFLRGWLNRAAKYDPKRGYRPEVV